MPLILPPTSSVEADERTSVSSATSADYVRELRCSSSALPTREPHSISRDSIKLESTVDRFPTNTGHRRIARLHLDYQSLLTVVISS